MPMMLKGYGTGKPVFSWNTFILSMLSSACPLPWLLYIISHHITKLKLDFLIKDLMKKITKCHGLKHIIFSDFFYVPKV